MNEYLNAFQNMTQSADGVVTDELNSLEIQQSATSLKASVQPCIEELKQSASRLEQLVLGCSDALYHAENVWISKARIAEAAKPEIWEQLGEVSGRCFRIHRLGSQCKAQAIKQAQKLWEDRIEFLRKKWFFDTRGQQKQGIGWSEKIGFITEIYPRIESHLQDINQILKDNLAPVYQEITNINLEYILSYIELLSQQDKIILSKQIDSIFSGLETKFSNPTVHLPPYLLGLNAAINPNLKVLTEQGWSDIYWKDVAKFRGNVSSKIDYFITAVFDDRIELATKAITKLIEFYNDFLERQERYQQETPEQREAEKAWIDQQHRELTRVQQGIEAILNEPIFNAD